MDYKQIPLSAIPSPPDEKDFKIARLLPMGMVFPEEYRSTGAPIKNQGMIGSCVPHAFSRCREKVEAKQRGKFTKLSPGFIYANRVQGDYEGEGMYPRSALKHLKNRGVCEYDLFPENDEYPVVAQLLKERWNTVMPNAAQYKISSYTFLETVNEIKMGIMALDAVTITIPVYENFYDTDSSGMVALPQGKLLGYHQMDLDGWTGGNRWVVANSWGEEWGDQGYCYIPFNFPLSEAWGLADNILPDQPYHDEFEVLKIAGSARYNRGNKSIIVHHPGDGLPPDISIEKRWNPHDYEYPAYDFGIEADGSVVEGRPLSIIGAHTRADKAPRGGDMMWYNKNAIGVVVAGDFTKYKMSDEQYNGLVKKVHELMTEYKIPIDEVKPHSAVSYTLCPGTSWDFNKFKNDLKKGDEEMLDNLVIYADGDTGTALILSQALGCPMVHKNTASRYQAKIEHYIGVDGKNTATKKYYFGANRRETAKKALE